MTNFSYFCCHAPPASNSKARKLTIGRGFGGLGNPASCYGCPQQLLIYGQAQAIFSSVQMVSTYHPCSTDISTLFEVQSLN